MSTTAPSTRESRVSANFPHREERSLVSRQSLPDLITGAEHSRGYIHARGIGNRELISTEMCESSSLMQGNSETHKEAAPRREEVERRTGKGNQASVRGEPRKGEASERQTKTTYHHRSGAAVDELPPFHQGREINPRCQDSPRAGGSHSPRSPWVPQHPVRPTRCHG
jgi:hypothetical protein